MEIARRYIQTYPSGPAAYIALECALMRRYMARGGTAEEFCERLAEAFHRRFGPMLLDAGGPHLPASCRPGPLTAGSARCRTHQAAARCAA